MYGTGTGGAGGGFPPNMPPPPTSKFVFVLFNMIKLLVKRIANESIKSNSIYLMNLIGGQDPLVLAASILATAINGAQQQQQQHVIQVDMKFLLNHFVS